MTNPQRWIARLGKALRLLGHPVYRAGIWLGVGAAIEHESALRPLALATVVDVGANKGQFSLLTRALFPEATIHAFEPLEEPQVRFRRLFAGDARVSLYLVALGDNSGTSAMHVSGRADSSSLLPITDRQEELFPGTASVGISTVTMARGDDILDRSMLARPLLVKLDVQGYELAALRGMPEILSCADFLYVEISFVELYGAQPLADEVISFLQERGFRLAAIYNLTTARDGTAIQADGLFSRAEVRD